MNLKCIGGECDGVVMYVDDAMRTGDHVRVPEKYKTSIMKFDPDVASQDMQISYHLYRIEIFHFEMYYDSYKFLVPEKWSDKQALLFQFNK